MSQINVNFCIEFYATIESIDAAEASTPLLLHCLGETTVLSAKPISVNFIVENN